MNRQDTRETYNFFAFGSDVVGFSIGLGFINFSTTLPAFAARLGASTIMVGFLITILSLSWSAPQFLASGFVARFERKKSVTIPVAFLGRPVMLAVAGLIALTHGEPPWLSFAALCLALVLFLGSDGFATLAWLDMLAHIFPAERRGRNISIWQAISALCLAGVSVVVSYILGDRGPEFPYNYALIFTLGGIALMISAVATALIHEPPPAGDAIRPAQLSWRETLAKLMQLWKSDYRLRRAAVARVLFSLGTMAFPFYVLYATEELHLRNETIGVFIFAQTVGTMIASLALGRVSDRYGSHRAVQTGALIVLTAPILALVMVFGNEEVISVVRQLYAWIYICIGLANNLLFLGFANYVLEIAPSSSRPMYTGIVNTLNSVGVLGPIFAGWLIAETSYSVLFLMTLGFSLLALVLAFRLPTARAGTAETQPS